MDSLSQMALGAAVAVAAMGRSTRVGKAALWGAVAGTLPDLDVLVAHGDPILDMVRHRSESHALLWLTLFSLPWAGLVAWLSGERERWRRWWWAMWLALVTHPLLDAMTVYGTRLALPWSDQPFAVGSVFIIDPLYTLPLLAGLVCVLRAPAAWGRAANLAGLTISGAYLGWSVLAQALATDAAERALAAQGIRAERLLVTPTAFNTVLWRVVAIDGGDYHEGFWSLLDEGPEIRFDRFDRGTALAADIGSLAGVRRLQAFSGGFWALWEAGGRLGITDLRMGQEPHYVFRFALAERRSPVQALAASQLLGSQPDLGPALAWLWRRALGQRLPPPR